MSMRNVRLDQLGMTVRAKRLEHGMTQHDLGTSVGVSRQTIARLENGANETTVGVLSKCLRALDVQLAVDDADTDNTAEDAYPGSAGYEVVNDKNRDALLHLSKSATEAARALSTAKLPESTQQALARAFEGLNEIAVPPSTQKALNIAFARLAETSLPPDTRAAIGNALNSLWASNIAGGTGDAVDRSLENMAKAVLERRNSKS